MGKKRSSVRGGVIEKWQRSSQPGWDVYETIDACIDIDTRLEKQGLEPAVQFRKAVKNDDKKYIRTWVLGCHFSWLNPREK